MITYIEDKDNGTFCDGGRYRGVHATLYGLSTDEKPTDVPNASVFYEMDKVNGVNRVFLFDEENQTWLEQ